MKLIPVEGDPFGEDKKAGYKLVPVEGNPFAGRQPNQAAMNPEAQIGSFTIKGETDSGFNPAAALIRAGHGLNKLNQGALRIMRTPADWVATNRGERDPIAAAIDKEQEEAKQPMADLAEVHPGSSLLGDVAPLVAAPMRALPALAAIEYGTPEEKLKHTALAFAGNKLGEMGGKALGRVAQPVREGELSQAQQVANAAADKLGVKLSAGEASGSRALKWAESSSGDLPIAAGMSQKRHQANAAAINTAAARSIGQEASELTPSVLAKAREDTSGIYKSVLANTKIELDSGFRAEVQQITNSKVMKELRDESTDAIVGKFQSLPEGKISVTGEWFQQNKTALDQTIRSAYQKGESGKAIALEKFEKALDRAAMRSMNETEREAYKRAQRQWANLRMLETGKVVEGGNAMPGRLDTALTTRYKGAYKEGKIKGELPDIASLASVLRPPPNSGSVPRAFYTGGIGGAAFAEPMTALGMLAGPAAMQGLMTAPAMRKYLSGGGLLGAKVTPEMEKKLMKAGGYAALLGYVNP